MHEAAVARRLLARARDAAGDARVVALHLTLGAFSQESPEHLRDHFSVVAAGTSLAGVQLVIERGSEPSFGVRLVAVDVEGG